LGSIFFGSYFTSITATCLSSSSLNKTSPKLIAEPQGKISAYFFMPQNDNNSKTVSQLPLIGHYRPTQNESGLASTSAPEDFQPEID
jgi:hypothetical protein